MIFADLFFIYAFFALCIIMYFISKNITYRNIVLVVFSLIFYAWGEPAYIVLLLFTTFINYLSGLLIEKAQNKKRSGRLILALVLIVDLGLLGVFKYSDFIITNINALFSLNIPLPEFNLPLGISFYMPIGISFYTFQTISYIMDCYWGTTKVQHNYGKFLMYISLFPQLVAGPIVRYHTVAAEIDNRTTTAADVSAGITRIIIGLAKKVLLANSLSVIVDGLFAGSGISELSVLATWFGAIIFALQVYFDFSGYSDMAIGMGLIFGFHFDENFKHPFISKNITEFWQRWHISLGTFFKDYLLYVPIFGKRRQYLSLFLVWFCTGLWHGASWNFIIWGLYFGIFIMLERLITIKRMKKIPSLLSHIYAMLIVIVGFGIFYFTDMTKLGDFFKNIIGLNGNAFADKILLSTFMNNIFLIAVSVICSLPIVSSLKRLVEKRPGLTPLFNTLKLIACIALLIVSTIFLVDATNNPFLYFNF